MDTATTEIYTLSLHDALPIFDAGRDARQLRAPRPAEGEERNREEAADADHDRHRPRHAARAARSEEHTSELQSQSNLVCRLLLEKKNTQSSMHDYNKAKTIRI